MQSSTMIESNSPKSSGITPIMLRVALACLEILPLCKLDRDIIYGQEVAKALCDARALLPRDAQESRKCI